MEACDCIKVAHDAVQVLTAAPETKLGFDSWVSWKLVLHCWLEPWASELCFHSKPVSNIRRQLVISHQHVTKSSSDNGPVSGISLKKPNGQLLQHVTSVKAPEREGGQCTWQD